MAEDRMAALRKRFSHTDGETSDAVASKPGRKSDRARHTLYLDKRLVSQVDTAFKAAAHELYPREIEKADYLEACLTFALAHQDEIKASLATS